MDEAWPAEAAVSLHTTAVGAGAAIGSLEPPTAPREGRGRLRSLRKDWIPGKWGSRHHEPLGPETLRTRFWGEEAVLGVPEQKARPSPGKGVGLGHTPLLAWGPAPLGVLPVSCPGNVEGEGVSPELPNLWGRRHIVLLLLPPSVPALPSTAAPRTPLSGHPQPSTRLRSSLPARLHGSLLLQK